MRIPDKTYLRLAAFVPVVCVGLGIIYFALAVPADVAVEAVQTENLPFAKEEQFWQEEIARVGGDAALEIFKKTYEHTDPLAAHAHAHAFGSALFDAEGISGVAVCDSSFSFGCYHSFFGRAISVHGLPVITELDQACIARWGQKGLGCSHGIGHGIMWHLGPDHLQEALDACATLSWKEPIGGCSSGVFMEYNFQTMADPNGSALRAFDASAPYAPCDTLPGQFRESCYFEQPQWWWQVLSNDYVQVGNYCADIESLPEREACFRGFGNVVPANSSYDVAESVRVCNTVEDRENAHLCLQGASWGFAAQTMNAQASEVCESLPPNEWGACFVGADFFNDREH